MVGANLAAIDHRVEAALQQADQCLAGIAALTLGFGIDAAELLFGQVAVMALQLLLGAKLDTEIGHLALAALSVLAGAVLAAIHRGFRTAPDIFAHAAVEFVFRLRAFGHQSLVYKVTALSSSLAGDRPLLAKAASTNESTARNWAARGGSIARRGAVVNVAAPGC